MGGDGTGGAGVGHYTALIWAASTKLGACVPMCNRSAEHGRPISRERAAEQPPRRPRMCVARRYMEVLPRLQGPLLPLLLPMLLPLLPLLLPLLLPRRLLPRLRATAYASRSVAWLRSLSWCLCDAVVSYFTCLVLHLRMP